MKNYNQRKGLGIGKGSGYYNIAPMDSHVHSLSAKGVKSCSPCMTFKKLTNLNARGSMQIIRLDPEYSVVFYSEDTRNGFRHVAILMKNGYEVDKATASYQNRTWESYGFQTVLHDLFDKAFEPQKAKILKEDLDKVSTSYPQSLMAKGKKRDYMKAVVKFEDLNPDYPSTQMEGIALETERKFQSPNYINEKVENTKRFYDGLLDNFGRRIKNPDIQKEFQERLKSGKLDAKATLTKKEKEMISNKVKSSGLKGMKALEYAEHLSLSVIGGKRFRDFRQKRMSKKQYQSKMGVDLDGKGYSDFKSWKLDKSRNPYKGFRFEKGEYAVGTQKIKGKYNFFVQKLSGGFPTSKVDFGYVTSKEQAMQLSKRLMKAVDEGNVPF